MSRRYSYTRRRSRRDPENRRRRNVFMHPAMQVAILLIAALVVYILLQNAGG